MWALHKLRAIGAMGSLLFLAGMSGLSGAQADTLVNASGELLSGDAILDDGSLYDQYTFTGNSGQYVTIFLDSADFDPYLILLDPNGERISENDDISRSNRNARLVVNLDITGVYTAVANSYESGNSGEYVIRVETSDSRESLLQTLAAAAVPGSTEICQSTIVNAVATIEDDRSLAASVSPVTLERLYTDVPTGRANGMRVALSGPAAESVMSSPQLLLGLSNELVDNCDSVGAVVFSSDESEFERTFGVVDDAPTRALTGRRPTRSETSRGPQPIAAEFVCTSSASSQSLPDWGEKACL